VIQAMEEVLSPDRLDKVEAWINIGGILRGSALADSAIHWPKQLLVRLFLLPRDWDFNSIVSMTTERSHERLNRIHLPSDILYLNYVGIPLSGHITKRAKGGYSELRELGPKDGLTLIPDEIIPSSVTIAEIGLDHYFLDYEIELKTVALVQLVINYLEESK